MRGDKPRGSPVLLAALSRASAPPAAALVVLVPAGAPTYNGRATNGSIADAGGGPERIDKEDRQVPFLGA